MFYRISALSFFALCLFIGAVSYVTVKMRPGDRLLYQKLIQESAELRSKRALERHPAHQTRTVVQKDVWSNTEKGRSHFCLKSEDSDLIIQQKKDKFEATEYLHNLEGVDHVNTLVAKRGVYFFPTHRFLAEKLSFTGTPISFSAHTMNWDRAKNKAHFQGDVRIVHGEQMSAEGDEATVSYEEEFAVDSLLLVGSVRLVSTWIEEKESFALADSLAYKPKERLFILSAIAPKRVLFWQDDLQMSAPEVHIRRTEEGHDLIEGIGDVHFAFDLEEEDAINQFFRNLL